MRELRGVGLCLFLSLVCAGPAVASSGMNVNLRVASDSSETLRETPVMISVIEEGEVVAQDEVKSNLSANFNLPPGVYDVRLEGDGMQTLVKRGIQVVPDRWTQVQGGPCNAGDGVHIVEYAHTGLSREEIAARLVALENHVAILKKAMEELQQRDE